MISLPILTFAFYFQFFAFLSSITRLLLYDSFIDFFFYDSGAHGVESRSRRINTAAGTVRRRFLRPQRESKKSELISFSHSYSDRSLFYCDYRDDRMSSGHCLAPTLMTRRRAEENKSPNWRDLRRCHDDSTILNGSLQEYQRRKKGPNNKRERKKRRQKKKAKEKNHVAGDSSVSGAGRFSFRVDDKLMRTHQTGPKLLTRLWPGLLTSTRPPSCQRLLRPLRSIGEWSK